MVRCLMARGLPREDAEDIFQEASMRLLDRSPDDPAAYLWRTIRNLLVRRSRHLEVRQKPVWWVSDALHPPRPRPDLALFEKECAQLLETLLLALPEREAEVARLLASDLTAPEIARELGLSSSAVRSRIQLLRERLRREWPPALCPEGRTAS